MATIDEHLGDGARGESRESGVNSEKELFEAVADDTTAIIAAFNLLLAKLDADTGLDEDDYVATLAIASQNLNKSS